jgi:carboxyl-terminal processing protease
MIRPFVIAIVAALAATATASCAQDAKPPARKAMALNLEQIQTLTDAIERLKADYVRPLSGDEILEQTLKGLLERIDPEGGEYLTRSEFEEFKRGLGGSAMAGAGMDIHARPGGLGVLPVEGGPAALAGMRAGDMLRSIDGVPVTALRPSEAAKLLRGAAGSRTTVLVNRAGAADVLRFELERRVVPYPPVRLWRPDGDLAVLRVPPLQERTLQDTVDSLKQEWTRQPFRGLVLDLRQNIGGLLTSAIGIAAIFLPPGEVVAKTSGQITEANRVYRASPDDYLGHGADPLASLPPALRRVPLVVLVDESTASGAEIVAAALRDHGRAALVGHATYGRGSIQTIMPLSSGGAMKITTATYTTPSGSAIAGKGLQPDVAVVGDDDQQALQAALATLRKRL